MIDAHSSTWRVVATELRRVESEAIAQIAQRGLGLAETEFERGRIAAVRSLLGLVSPADEFPLVEPVSYEADPL